MSASRHERKVVTVLFCDLVGFTSRAEEMDPEDVAALLGPYHARLKEELESFGGTVEKFIGDAVMALFGAPVAHEDDPERAVRAALAIREFATAEGIELRIGITTGEALINLVARPDAGETIATGDVVNTAARLQSAAPINGVLVSEKTYEATKHAIEYAEANPVDAKGKVKPVAVWEALSAAPLQDRAHTTPLVGRERELELLRKALDHVQAKRSPQLVTIVGPPGIGKSRLVHELSQADGELTWRKGRCLPYGAGAAFWALGEIVKQHAGILDSDPPATAEKKLLACVEDAWIADHLRPLVGAGEGRETTGDRRAEAFSAWRRFLTMLAEEQPLALVLEDIHWADEALLDFVDQLVEWAQEAPLLVLCTARPELVERRPSWGATTIPLAPLSDEETGLLLSALVEREASAELVARAAGNPLYAEQYARLLAEGGSAEDLPATVQGIIAARLDGLTADEKALVQDAAVIGRVFWSGAVAALAGGDRWSIEERLLALERRELVRRERRSSVEDETEYGFAHILLCDVAYAEIPRAERSARHRLAAEWIEALGRTQDHADLVAHHYLKALELAQAVGEETGDLARRARLALRDAGERSLALGAFITAVGQCRAALELWPVDDHERPYLLRSFGTALGWAEDSGEAELAEARDQLVAAGDPGAAAEAELLLVDIALRHGELRPVAGHLERAGTLVRELGTSRPKARFLGQLARFHMMQGQSAEAIRLGRQALTMANELALDELRPQILNTVGVARLDSGDSAGVEDIEQSIELALGLHAVPDVLRGYNNLAVALATRGDLRRSRRVLEKGQQAAERFGELRTRGSVVLPEVLRKLGEWDEALRMTEELIAVPGGQGSGRMSELLATRADIRFGRGDVAGALADLRAADEHARASGDERSGITWIRAWMLLEVGLRKEAEGLATEQLSIARASDPGAVSSSVAAHVLRDLGRTREALDLLARAPRTKWRDAAELVLNGKLVEAADVYAEMGNLSREAYVRLKAAEQLDAQGRRAEAGEQLERALVFWRSVGATRYIREAEALLAGTG